jgi:hypothetical protein
MSRDEADMFVVAFYFVIALIVLWYVRKIKHPTWPLWMGFLLVGGSTSGTVIAIVVAIVLLDMIVPIPRISILIYAAAGGVVMAAILAWRWAVSKVKAAR